MAKCRTYRDPAIVAAGDIPLSDADELETHPAVLAAINAIASDRRPARVIWHAPTGPECDSIVMAVEEYIYLGDFKATSNNIYRWGADEIRRWFLRRATPEHNRTLVTHRESTASSIP